MNNESRKLLVIGMLFMAALGIANTFVNVYLIRVSDSITLILMQNILYSLALLGAFMGGAKLVAKHNITLILRVGILLVMSYYLAILILQENTPRFLIPLGIFLGVGQGFYYFAFNILLGRLVPGESMGRFISLQQTFGNFFGIISPMVSGFIIVRFTELTGYYILFGASVVLFLIGVAFGARLPGFTSENKLRALPILKLKGNPYWDANKYYQFGMGVAMMIFGQIFILLAFSILGNEQQIGLLNSVHALVALLSSLWFAKTITNAKREIFHLIMASVFFTVTLILGIFATPWALIAASMGIGVVFSWNMAIFQSMKYQLSDLAKGGFSQEEYIVATEFPIAAGRVAGLVIGLIVSALLPTEIAYRVLIVLVGVFYLLNHLIIKLKVNWLADK